MNYIDHYAYISAFKDVKPQLKLLFGLSALAAAVCSAKFWAFAFMLGAMSLITVFGAKIPAGFYARLFLLPLGFLLFGVAGIAVNMTQVAPADTVWHMRIFGAVLYTSMNGITTAAMLAFKSLSAVSCLYFIILTTPIRDIVVMLHRVKCPNTIIMLTMLTYRFIFLLMDLTTTKMKSQQCRHGYIGSKRFLKTFGMLWGSVFIQAMQSSEWVFKAMQVRGIDREIRFLPKAGHLAAPEVCGLVCFLGVIISLNFIG